MHPNVSSQQQVVTTKRKKGGVLTIRVRTTVSRKEGSPMTLVHARGFKNDLMNGKFQHCARNFAFAFS